MFVIGSIDGNHCNITVDTGSDISVLHPDLLRREKRDSLQPVTSYLRTVTGVLRLKESPGEQQQAAKLPEHLKELYRASTDGLTPNQQTQVYNLLCELADVFSQGPHDLGRTDLVQHCINTRDASPIRQPPRRLPLTKQQDAAKAVEDMEKEGVIETSCSPWASPIVLVKKKDGSTRFCVDYRELNNVTRKDSYPLPRMDDTLEALNGATWFSTLDLNSGYWQVEVHPSDGEKTAFSTGKGLQSNAIWALQCPGDI